MTEAAGYVNFSSSYVIDSLASRLRHGKKERFPAMKKESKHNASPMRFESMLQTDVPKGRDGKHKVIIEQLISDLDRLEDGKALKIPLSALPDTKENIRSALSRATKKIGIEVATSSDEDFLYVWKPNELANTGTTS
jgi:hypothetical protein